MIYALLWIEALVVALLWVAAWAACISHLGWGWMRRWLTAPVVLIPLLLFTASALFAGVLKYQAELEVNWFSYTVSLWVLFVMGTSLILIAASRRAAGLGPAARLWPRGRLALAALAAFAVGAMTLWNGDLTARAQAAITKAQAGAMFLAVVPPALPDSENAAVLYDKVLPQFRSDPLANGEQFDPKPDEPQYIELVRRMAGTLRLLRRAAAMPNCRFDLNWARPDITLVLPSLGDMRTAALLLQLDAQIELHAGHVDAALADVSAINGMADHVGQEPILVSGLVAYGMDGIADRTLQEILGQVTRLEQLANVIGFDPAADHRVYQRCLRGEECFGMTTYSELQSGEMSPSYIAAMGSEKTVPVIEFPPEPIATIFRLFVVSNGLDSYTKLMDEYQDLAHKPYYEAKPRLDAIAADSKNIRRQGYFQAIFMPMLTRSAQTAAAAEAGDAGAQVGLAATRYRLEHGSLPVHLADLVPDYLDAVPLDPFDGQALRLVIKDGHWTVYSIGPDGRDDGGRPEVWNAKEEKNFGDVTFVLPMAGGVATQP